MIPLSRRRPGIASDVEDALNVSSNAPWMATGRISPQDARLFAAAMIADPALADDLAAARAEMAAVRALAGYPARPSIRPLLALFAAIDAETPSTSNVTNIAAARNRRAVGQGPLTAGAAVSVCSSFRR